MKAAFQVKSLVVGVLMLCTAMGCAGLTLGRAQGAIFVGKPLDLRVQLQFDGSEEVSSGCMVAEVSYGDSQLDSARITVTVEPATGRTTQGATVRVESPVLIDEPVVTVNLRAVCQSKTSRRYTLFPDVSTNVVEPVAAAPARRTPAPLALPVVPSAATVPARPAAQVAQAAAPAASPNPAPAPRKARAVAATAAAEQAPATARVQAAAPLTPPAALPLRPRAAKAAGRSRLKLDSLDLLIERDPVLKASDELLTPPQENSPQRTEAAALWRALNASPEEILHEEARAQEMARDLKALYAVTNENQKGLMELANRVQRAESERYANGLVYGLMALCLAAVLALAWVWRRLRSVARTPSWSQGLDAGDSLMAELVQHKADNRAAPAGPQPVAPLSVPAHAPVRAAAPLTEVDFDLDLMAPASAPPPPPREAPAAARAFASPLPAPMPVPVPVPTAVAKPSPESRRAAHSRDFSASMSAGLRAIDSEELVDVRQQADFFVSLGEHQKAIDILTTRIAQCGESSPLVCLDLLKIYHALGREPEFAFMRTEFNNWFTGRVPEFAAFGDEGRPLEHYPQVMRQIVSLWPDPRVLEYIENCLYHHSSDDDVLDFDLQAYRDLLLLHSVAKRIVRLSDDAGESHALELIRIPPRAPAAPVGGLPSDPVDGDAVVHRAGAQHRGAWKRSVAPVPDEDPQADVETSGAPLGAMKVPPVEPVVLSLDEPLSGAAGEPDQGSLTDFNFLNLR
jgi:hypothetical protein